MKLPLQQTAPQLRQHFHHFFASEQSEIFPIITYNCQLKTFIEKSQNMSIHLKMQAMHLKVLSATVSIALCSGDLTSTSH